MTAGGCVATAMGMATISLARAVLPLAACDTGTCATGAAPDKIVEVPLAEDRHGAVGQPRRQHGLLQRRDGVVQCNRLHA